MNSYLKKIISVITCAALSALFILSMFFCSPKIADVPEIRGRQITEQLRVGEQKWENFDFTAGEDFAAVSIEDLTETGRITKVNYVADKFVQAGHLTPEMQIVDLTKPFKFAENGSLVFVIFNLDPYDEAFFEKSERLEPFLIGDRWHFTFSLPKIFCASNVYVGQEIVARNGAIAGYNFGDFGAYYGKTDEFSPLTKTTDVEVQFRNKQGADLNYKLVTVHYQSTGSGYSGITDCPLIGTDDAIEKITENSQNLLIAFAIIAVVEFAVFVVLSILERSTEFVSAIIIVSGIFFLLLARFYLISTTDLPLLWTAFRLAAPLIVLCGALVASGRNFGRVPAKYISAALAAAGAVLAFICPYVPLGASSVLAVICTVVKAVCVAALLLFIGFATFRKDDCNNILRTVCSSLVAVAITSSFFLPQIFPTRYNPMFWMCVAALAAIFVSVFIVFMDVKKSNIYLTTNLHSEVERQLKDIRAIISERDNLLQFVSHDMRKPLNSSVSLLETAIAREKDAEQIKTLQIIKQNDSRVVANLSEIAAFAKLNYISEPSQVADLSALCASICRFHSFDCNANGIVLNNLATKRYKVFVKPQGFENAVSNIIMNAVEHANCSQITLSVKTVKNKVVLCIADDGKGIAADLDVFKPYVSERLEKSETGGLGLYICKNIIESMNGTLSYESGSGGTAFYISLLKA